MFAHGIYPQHVDKRYNRLILKVPEQRLEHLLHARVP